jgi:hypothetical protein
MRLKNKLLHRSSQSSVIRVSLTNLDNESKNYSFRIITDLVHNQKPSVNHNGNQVAYADAYILIGTHEFVW